ncbi:MAG: helix-turn-helix domain-containing protein [Vulcanimicrobiaceae bacterium]
MDEINSGRLTLNVAEAAKALGISEWSVYGAIKRKEIPSVRINGRILIPRVALERMLDPAIAQP